MRATPAKSVLGISREAARGWAGRFLRDLRYQLVFISFIRPAAILAFRPYLSEVDVRYLPRMLCLCILGFVARPLCWLETMGYGRKIAATRLEQPPIFIIGHWRSGTTHIHNLMSCDRNLGYVSMYQAIAPDCSLIGQRWLKPLLACILPAKRPMDEMVWPIDSPQEEEVALGKMTQFSFYVQFLFPRQARHFFERHVLGLDPSGAVTAEIRPHYLRLLKIATLHARGRRLVLKNPVNTARVRLLLEMFPGAKFIHIHRSPYDVYASTRNLQQKILSFTTLQNLEKSGSDEMLLALYEGMMHRFLEDRRLIPKGNLVEIRFDDLERDPVGEIERLYAKLGLPGFEAMRHSLETYVGSLRGYRKNRFDLQETERERIRHRWGFAFHAFDYPLRNEIQAGGSAK